MKGQVPHPGFFSSDLDFKLDALFLSLSSLVLLGRGSKAGEGRDFFTGVLRMLCSCNHSVNDLPQLPLQRSNLRGGSMCFVACQKQLLRGPHIYAALAAP